MRNTSTKLLLAISGALAAGSAGLAVAQENSNCNPNTQAYQSQQAQPQQASSSTSTSTAGDMTAANWNSTDRDQATGTTSTSDQTATGTTMDSDQATGATAQSADRMASNTQSSAQSTNGGTRSSNAGQGTEVLWLVMPVSLQSQSDRMSNGCWVRLYSGDNFEGRYMTVVGPTEVAELRSPYGTGLNNWESAVVGPNATVVTYDSDNFKSRDATLRAGQHYPQLNDSRLGLFQDIESVKVKCNSQQTGQTGTQTATSQ